MSIHAWTGSVIASDLPRTAKATALVLAHHASDDAAPTVEVSRAQLAEEVGVGLRTMSRARRTLEVRGFLTVLRHGGSPYGIPSLLRLTLPPVGTS